jgi:uncharacterized protein
MAATRPTLLGYVGAVTGAFVSVLQSPSVASGVAIIGGKSYRIGQVGSFIRIPQGYNDLYGIVTEVGASAIPKPELGGTPEQNRWMTIQLLGEIVGTAFERGISQYPSVNDEVHLVTEDDLALIYGTRAEGQIVVGRLANAESIPVRVDLDKLVTRHSAVLGSTGSGKSTTVASLLRSIACGDAESEDKAYPSARIILLDIHGEYGRALRNEATVFRTNPNPGEEPLLIPYWALDASEIMRLVLGSVEDRALTQIFDKITAKKIAAVRNGMAPGTDENAITADTPVPFSLKQLWFDLIDPEVKTWADTTKTTRAIDPADEGDAQTLRVPKYKMHGAGNAPPFMNMVGVLGIRRQLDQMRSRLLDKQYDFLLHPGDWEPDLTDRATRDLPELLASWVGGAKPITILDLSGVPSSVLDTLVGAILKIVYEGLYWSREKSEGGINRPLLVVMDEAHRYLSRDSKGTALNMVQRIMREGRKFGIGGMIISQRPSDVNETVLSQCGTMLALRLTNSADRAKVQASLPDSLAGIIESLPILRVGEAIITGEAARLPIRCRITLPRPDNRPDSEDPKVAERWSSQRITENYNRVMASWRSQNPRWAATRITRQPLQKEQMDMERNPVSSSMVLSVGYDETSQTLEVEFNTNLVYQYYNVPTIVYEQMMAAESIGKFINGQVKPNFPCSRV